MSPHIPAAARPTVGDLLHCTGIEEPLPVVATQGQWVSVLHPVRGEFRFHVSDDRVPDRPGAWRIGDLLLEVTP